MNKNESEEIVFSREEEELEIRSTAVLLARQGNSEGMKLLQDIHQKEDYNNLISYCDDDEYEFAN